MRVSILLLTAFFAALSVSVGAAPPVTKSLSPLVCQGMATVRSAQTLSVDVTQVVPPGSIADNAHLVFARPNKIKLTVRVGQAITGVLVSDGKTQYQWDASQVAKTIPAATVEKIDNPMQFSGDAAGLAVAMLFFPDQLLGQGKVRDLGTVRWHGMAAEKIQADSATTHISAWLAKSNGLPLQVAMDTPNRTETFTFTHYALNKPVAATAFTAHPPKGLVAYVPPSQQQEPELIKPGSPAPDFTLSTPEGKTVSLSSLRGKPVLIDFWATWCGPCMMAMPHIQHLHQKLGDTVTVLSINTSDQQPAWRAFVKKNKQYTTTMLFDGQDVSGKLYLVSGIPTVYLIDKDGNVAASFVGYDPDGEKQIETALNQLNKG